MNVKIRSWIIDDAESIVKIINNKNVQDNLRDGIPFPYSISDAKDFILAMLEADSNNTFAWAITVDDIVAGSIGVFRKDNVHRLTAEMGYFIGEQYWNKGIMTLAVKQACSYMFANTDIVRIFANPYAFNTSSCRVLEKAGFLYEGTLKKNAIKHGRILDMKMYANIKD